MFLGCWVYFASWQRRAWIIGTSVTPNNPVQRLTEESGKIARTSLFWTWTKGGQQSPPEECPLAKLTTIVPRMFSQINLMGRFNLEKLVCASKKFERTLWRLPFLRSEEKERNWLVCWSLKFRNKSPTFWGTQLLCTTFCFSGEGDEVGISAALAVRLHLSEIPPSHFLLNHSVFFPLPLCVFQIYRLLLLSPNSSDSRTNPWSNFFPFLSASYGKCLEYRTTELDGILEIFQSNPKLNQETL